MNTREVNWLVLESVFGVHVSMASLLLRLAVGVLFVIHGYPKLGAGTKGTGEWLKTMGLTAGFAPFAGVVEFFGGLALLLGILTPIVAVLSALWMVSTTWLSVVKMKKKFVGGYELDIVLLLASLALAAVGAGRFSVDYLIGI
jgi:putative oxidoreductase